MITATTTETVAVYEKKKARVLKPVLAWFGYDEEACVALVAVPNSASLWRADSAVAIKAYGRFIGLEAEDVMTKIQSAGPALLRSMEPAVRKLASR